MHNTHTNKQFGIIQLSIQYILQQPNVNHIEMRSVEIYNNVVHDHLHPMSPSVIVREIVDELIYKKPLIIHKLTNFEQFNKLLSILLKQKSHIGQTDLNNDSSRSHIIYKFKINFNNQNQCTISFVDLAGMERMKFAPKYITPIHKKECCHINQSLFALKECIRAIEKKQNYIPYRRTKLTLLLKEFFRSTNIICIATLNPLVKCVPDIFDTIRYIEALTNYKLTVANRKPIVNKKQVNNTQLPSTQRLNNQRGQNIQQDDKIVIQNYNKENIKLIVSPKRKHPINILKQYEKYIFYLNSLIRKDYKHYKKFNHQKQIQFIDYIIKLISNKIVYLNNQKIYFQQLYLENYD